MLSEKANLLKEWVNCPDCGNRMEPKGDMRYEDICWKCPKCGKKRTTIIRG